MPVWAAIVVALVSTVLINVGFVLQKRGVVQAAARPDDGRRQAGRLFRTRVWRVGLAVMSVGWGLYMLAARFAPISIVQPALGAGFIVLALFAVFYLGERVGWIEWAALAAMLIGTLLLGWSAGEETASGAADGARLAVFTAAVVTTALLLFIAGHKGRLAWLNPDVLAGLSAGLLIGVGSVYLKAMFNYDQDHNQLIAYALCLPLAIVLNLSGFVMIQDAFKKGKALLVVPLQQVINKLIAIAGGMAALGEHLPAEPLPAAMRIAAFILILLSAGALARFGGEELSRKMRQSPERNT